MAGAKPLLAAAILTLPANAPPFEPTAADQAAARATLLKASDLGTSWTGGVKPAGKPSPPSCPGFAPKESDLTVTGHALSTFQKDGVDVESDVEVLQTSAFVRTDFSRTIRPPLARCLGLTFEQQSGGGTTVKVVSSTRVSFPTVAPLTAAYRVVADVATSAGRARLLVDFVFIGKNRTEITLDITAPVQAQSALRPVEARLAKILAARAKV